MNKIVALAIGILLLCTVFSGCINQADEGDQQRQELLIIGISEDPYGFFPWITSYDVNTMGINFNIFNALVEFDNSFKLFPKLAKSWDTPNNCTWRFYLRDDITFHNGYNFTAEDVKYTIDLIKNNKSHVLRDLLTEVKEVSVVSRYTIDIVTNQPVPILLNKLTGIPITSKRYMEETNEKWPIGTGAYKLLEYEPKDHVTLVRFENYSLGDPQIKKVIFTIIQNSEERKDALINQEIHIMEHVPEMYVNEIQNSSGITLKKVSNPTVWYISFDFRQNNSSGFPGTKNPLADVRIRKAMYHAIDVDSLITRLSLDVEPASQFLSPLIFGYNPEINRLPCDVNLSRQLLSSAGYENGFHLTLDCPEEYPTLINLSEEIVRQFSQIVNVSLNLIPADEYYHKLYDGNCSVYIMGWIPATGDGGEIFDYLLRSEHDPLGIGSYNFGHYSNQTVDRFTSEIAHTMDQSTRKLLMRGGFTVAMDDIACIPLYISVCNIGMAEYIVWNPRSDLSTLVEEITVK